MNNKNDNSMTTTQSVAGLVGLFGLAILAGFVVNYMSK